VAVHRTNTNPFRIAETSKTAKNRILAKFRGNPKAIKTQSRGKEM